VSGEEAYAKDQLLRSSMVMSGSGLYVVTAVGDETEIGHVARQSTEITGVKTPLNIQLDRLAKLISKVGIGLSVAAFVVFLVHDILTDELWHTTDYVGMTEVVLKYFMMAVTLIVMAVPEGLPMAVTLALALNMRRMLKSNNLVRKLQASETMGAVTVMEKLLPSVDWEEAQNVGYDVLVSGKDYLLAFIALVVIAPICEEILFRGWLYGKLRGRMKALPAILLTSLMFGIVHLQWNVGVTVFVMSVFMCIMRELTGAIYSGIILHMIKNGLAFYLLFMSVPFLQY
jgi:membrane protease YdiL (CAAX protease family)